jgi:lipopolysaccharide/colanic/teichoic acid biosynthesis glycosyltransferase
VNELGISMLKFRTMYHDPAALREQLEAAKRGGRSALQDPQRSKRPAIGALLRRLSPDEVSAGPERLAR